MSSLNLQPKRLRFPNLAKLTANETQEQRQNRLLRNNQTRPATKMLASGPDPVMQLKLRHLTMTARVERRAIQNRTLTLDKESSENGTQSARLKSVEAALGNLQGIGRSREQRPIARSRRMAQPAEPDWYNALGLR
jgi:hypothetical protein